MDAPPALLTDFGGLLTSSVADAIRAWSSDVCGDPELVLDLLRTDQEAARLLAEHECGGIDEAWFEAGMALRMRRRGVDAAPGLVTEVGVRKPSRRIYALACGLLGVEPTDALMLDDLQQSLDGAARLGIRGRLHSPTTPTAALLTDWFATAPGLATATANAAPPQ